MVNGALLLGGCALAAVLTIERAQRVAENPVSSKVRIHDHKTGNE
jgi:hypothetical protein